MFGLLANRRGASTEDEEEFTCDEVPPEELLATLTGMYLDSSRVWAEESKRRCVYIEAAIRAVAGNMLDVVDSVGSVTVCVSSFTSDFKRYILSRQEETEYRFTKLWKANKDGEYDSLLMEGAVLGDLLQKLVVSIRGAETCFSALGNDLGALVILLDRDIPFWARCHAVECIAHLASLDTATTCSLLLRCPAFAASVAEMLLCSDHQVLLRESTIRLVLQLLQSSAEEAVRDESVCIMQEVLTFEGCLEHLFMIARQEGGLAADDLDVTYTQDALLCACSSRQQPRGSLGVVWNCISAIHVIAFHNQKVTNYIVDAKLTDHMKCFVDLEHLPDRLRATWEQHCGCIQLATEGQPSMKSPVIPFTRMRNCERSHEILTHERILVVAMDLLAVIVSTNSSSFTNLWVPQVTSKWVCTFASVVWQRAVVGQQEKQLNLSLDSRFAEALFKVYATYSSTLLSSVSTSFFGTQDFSSVASWFILLPHFSGEFRVKVLTLVSEKCRPDDLTEIMERESAALWFGELGCQLAQHYDEPLSQWVGSIFQTPTILTNLVRTLNTTYNPLRVNELVASIVLISTAKELPYSESLPHVVCDREGLEAEAASLVCVAAKVLRQPPTQPSIVTHSATGAVTNVLWHKLLESVCRSSSSEDISKEEHTWRNFLEKFSPSSKGQSLSPLTFHKAIAVQDEQRRKCVRMAFSLD